MNYLVYSFCFDSTFFGAFRSLMLFITIVPVAVLTNTKPTIKSGSEITCMLALYQKYSFLKVFLIFREKILLQLATNKRAFLIEKHAKIPSKVTIKLSELRF